MRFTKQTIVMVVTLVLSSVTATPVEIGVKELGERGKYDPAIAFATFTDSSCSSGQVDYHQADGICNNNLPGQSMKIWWLASGCRMLLGDCSNSAKPNWRYVSNDCVPIGDKYKYQIYC